MNPYLDATKFAAQSIITAYMHEFEELNAQIRRFQEAGDWLGKWNDETRGKGILDTATATESFPEQLTKMSKVLSEARQAGVEVYRLSDSLKAKEFATQSLCGALLQIAKQGISVVHKGLGNCPSGRMVGSQPIKDVIWHGRNQSMHYEEGDLVKAKKTLACFQTLDADLNLHLAASVVTTNLATNVIDVLKWHSYDLYEKDMASLLP